MNYTTLFAERIGGALFGQTDEIYKFEKIKRAKDAARRARPDVAILDPAPAVARQVRRVLAHRGALQPAGPGGVTYYTSGDPVFFMGRASRLVAIPGPVRAVRWAGEDSRVVEGGG